MTPEEIKLYGHPLADRPRCWTTSTHRRCNQCSQWLKHQAFGKNKHKFLNLAHICKKCTSENNKNRTKEKHREVESSFGPLVPGSKGKTTETHKRCPGCTTWKKHTEFNHSATQFCSLSSLCKECASYRHIQQRYGVSKVEYAKMLKAQSNKCAICDSETCGTAREGRLYVDHHHGTGEVRGLLCHSCNILLERAKESKEILASAIQYLAKGDT